MKVDSKAWLTAVIGCGCRVKVLEVLKDVDGDVTAARVYFVDSGRRTNSLYHRDNLIVLPDRFANVPYQVN